MSCINCSQNENCHSDIDQSKIRPLVYVQGLDANGCESIYPPQQADVCGTIASARIGSPLKTGDKVLGSDCKLHEFSQLPVSVYDTPSLDLNISGTTLSGNVNSTWIKGLFSTISDPCASLTYNDGIFTIAINKACIISSSLCSALNAITTSGNFTYESTQVLGKDCKVYTIPAQDLSFERTTGILSISGGGDSVKLTIYQGVSSPTIEATQTGIDTVSLAYNLKPSIETAGVVGNSICATTPLASAQSDTLVAYNCATQKWTTFQSPNLSVVQSPTVFLTPGGIKGHQLRADVNISLEPNNILVDNGGLFVPSSASVGVSDTSTLDLNLASNTISGNVKVSSTAGNVLSATQDGLYVGAQTQSSQQLGVSGTSITLTNSTPVDICSVLNNIPNGATQEIYGYNSGVGCVKQPLVLPSLCNSLIFSGSGLYSPNKVSFTVDTGAMTFGTRYGANVNGNDLYFGLGATFASSLGAVQPLKLTIRNGCTTADVTLHSEMGHFSWLVSNNDWSYRPFVSYKINGGASISIDPHFIHETGFSTTNPLDIMRTTANGTAIDTVSLNPNDEIEFSMYTLYRVAVGLGGLPMFTASPYNAQGVSMKMTAILHPH